ncbi:cupin domain-containing protein [Cupriavidus basilensis]
MFVIDGEGIVSLDGKGHELCQGAVIKIPRGVPHALCNTGAVPIELLVIHDPPLRIGAVTAGEAQGDKQLPGRGAEAERARTPEVVSTGPIAWQPFGRAYAMLIAST